MSADKLVDSTQLDSDLTSVADAIRAKSGGSSQLAFPAGFVSEIGNIPSGGGASISGISGAFKFGNVNAGRVSAPTITGNVTLDFTGYDVFFERLFQNSTKASGVGTTKLTIKCKSMNPNWANETAPNYLLYRSGGFDEVEIICSNANHVRLGISSFQGNGCAVKKISGTPIGLEYVTEGSYKIFGSNAVIQDVSFYENLSTQKIDFSACSAFTDATLVSLANALKVSTGSATLTLHSTPKGRLASIMGTVSQVTRDSETYDKFTADANGTVTLQNFITTTKGWTLA